jgi:transposase
MERHRLENMLAEGISLAEIGRRLGRHESTVSYWVDRHGLRANGRERYAARDGLAKDRLEALVDAGMSTSEIAAAVDRSKTSVRHWLRKHGLKTRRSAGSRPREATMAARAQGLSELLLSCPRHGEISHVRDSRGSYRCGRCRADAVVRRRRRVKQILVEEAGGRCRLCGYNASVVALEFHHLDPREKRFGVASRGVARSLDSVRAEVRKCVLLCSNCHAEVEAGIRSISGIVQLDSPG